MSEKCRVFILDIIPPNVDLFFPVCFKGDYVNLCRNLNGTHEHCYNYHKHRRIESYHPEKRL